MMKKILIVENTQIHFERVLSNIKAFFGNQVDVKPNMIDTRTKTLANWNQLISTVLLGEPAFPEILNQFGDIDLYIIDIALTSESEDEIGLNLWKYLKKHSSSIMPYFIIISNSVFSEDELEDTHERFVSKTLGDADFGLKVIEEICSLLKIDKQLEPPSNSANIGIENPANDVTSSTRKDPPWKLRFSFKERKERWGFLFAFRQLVKESEGVVARLLDIGIKIIFCMLIFATCLYAGKSILIDCWNAAFDNTTGEAKNKEILAIAEHLFLYLLPIFVVFGFYIYYKTNMSVYLLNGNTTKINEGSSTKAITMTKTLFIGSIISYSLIKVTEMLFPVNDQPASLLILISIGFLLLLLMVYFITLERLNHGGHRNKPAK